MVLGAGFRVLVYLSRALRLFVSLYADPLKAINKNGLCFKYVENLRSAVTRGCSRATKCLAL